MIWSNIMYEYYKKYKDTSVLHYEYADETKGIIPNIELTIDILKENFPNMVEWCVKNVENEWFWDFNDAHKNKGSYRNVIFYFEKRIDATTFRMIWG